MITAQAKEAIKLLAEQYLDNDKHACHAVYFGVLSDGREGIVVLVDNPTEGKDDAIAQSVLNGYPVEVRRAPRFKTLELYINAPGNGGNGSPFPTSELTVNEVSVYAGAETHRRCNDPVQGGDQVGPAGAAWVGTLSSAFRFEINGRPHYGCLTNYHVAVVEPGRRGHKLHQPHPGYGWIAELQDWQQLDFNGGANYIDAAILSCRQYNGKSIVQAYQRGLGPLLPDIVETPKIGDVVAKSGRTTGVVTDGTVVGIGAVVHVGYGSGRVAKFVDQIVIQRSGGGDFSGPGDSGSLIVQMADNGWRPYALLFAGSPGTTIANPIKYVVERFQGQFR